MGLVGELFINLLIKRLRVSSETFIQKVAMKTLLGNRLAKRTIEKLVYSNGSDSILGEKIAEYHFNCCVGIGNLDFDLRWLPHLLQSETDTHQNDSCKRKWPLNLHAREELVDAFDNREKDAERGENVAGRFPWVALYAAPKVFE